MTTRENRARLRAPTAVALVAACATMTSDDVFAQSDVLFTFSSDVFPRDGGGGLINAGRIRPDEVGLVRPGPGVYSARSLIGAGTQWAWRGDDDNDGNLVDSPTAAPGNDTDALMFKRFVGANPTPTVRDLCISKEDNYSTTLSFLDGDVIYHPTQGVVRTFVTEAQIASAAGATSVDVDAICQDFNGDLYFSFDVDETTSAGAAENSSILRIPAAAIAYDANGDVTSVTASSVELLTLEADLDNFLTTSGIRSNGSGSPFNSSNDLAGLDIDPAGGTWVSPQNGMTYPNLLMSWDSGASNDGGIVSTSGGGSIAVINGVSMGSSVATTGQHLGLLPQSTGQSDLFALAVVDGLQIPVTLENYPENQLTTADFGFSRQEVTGATPFAPVAFLLSFGPAGPGTALSSVEFPALFGGEFFEAGSAFVATTVTADPLGFADQILNVSGLIGSGVNICWQAFDFGTVSFSLPAPIQFP